jgi:hypothetical protein
MTEKETTLIGKYKSTCNDLAKVFLEDLYGDEARYYWEEAHWVADEVGGVFTWGDWLVNMQNITDYFSLEYTPDEFFEWYDDWMGEEPSPNMKNYKRFNK